MTLPTALASKPCTERIHASVHAVAEGQAERFARIETRLDRLESKFEQVGSQLAAVDTTFPTIDVKLTAMDVKLAAISALLLALVLPHLARADEPLPPPKPHQACSPTGAFCAVSDPAKIATTVFAHAADGSQRELWTIPGWHRVVDISDAGLLVTGNDGLDLIPEQYDESLALLSIYDGGKLVQRFSVKDLFPDRSVLEKTVSHYAWGSYRGWDADGNYQLKTIDGRILAFNAAGAVRPPGAPSGGPPLALYLGLGLGVLAVAVAVAVWLLCRRRAPPQRTPAATRQR